ncbi:MAG: hypothetical protein NC820_06610 [Candidatus Omnitrophica bacterium]|nr:hypothetical protein [Candidatus Omnitrophota bacterium]
MNILFYLFLIIFFPNKFISMATRDAIKKEFDTNKELLSTYPNKQLPPERESEFKKSIEESIKILRSEIIKAFLTIIATMSLAIVIGSILKLLGVAIHPRIVKVIQLLSACLFFVSVWGKLDGKFKLFQATHCQR